MIGDTSDSLIKYLRSVRDRQIQEINAIKKITILTPPPMSNYFCPRCGKAIIDNGGQSYHTCTPGYTGMTPAQSEFNNNFNPHV